MTVNLQDQQTQLVLQSLRATAQEVARVEGITYAQALERVMSVMCNDWSVQAGPGVQTLRQSLPPAEIGTAPPKQHGYP